MRSKKSFKRRQKYLKAKRLKEKLDAEIKIRKELRRDRNRALAMVSGSILILTVLIIASIYVIERYTELAVMALMCIILLVICAIAIAIMYCIITALQIVVSYATKEYKAYKARKLQELLYNIAEAHC